MTFLSDRQPSVILMSHSRLLHYSEKNKDRLGKELLANQVLYKQRFFTPMYFRGLQVLRVPLAIQVLVV